MKFYNLHIFWLIRHSMATIIIDGKEILYYEFEKLVYHFEIEDASNSDGSKKEDVCENDDIQEIYKTYISLPMVSPFFK